MGSSSIYHCFIGRDGATGEVTRTALCSELFPELGLELRTPI